MAKIPVTLINAQSVGASATDNHAVIPLDDSYSKAIIFVSNNGASTNLTVEFSSSSDAAGTIKAPLQPMTLSNTAGNNSCQFYLDVVPSYLWVVAIEGSGIATNYSVLATKITERNVVSVITSGQYAINSTGKTITFTDSSISLERITKIKNLTTGAWLYNADAGSDGEYANIGSAYRPVTMTNNVLTFGGNGVPFSANSDVLQIYIS